MKSFQLEGTVREVLGKKATKAARKVDNIPCVVYGQGENVHFEVSSNAVRKLIYSSEVFVVELTVAGKQYKAVLKDLQFHPVTDKVLHIDFLEVTAEKPVVFNIPVKLEGLAEGVRAGGKLTQEMRYLKVKATYDKLPEQLIVDVTSLGLGKTIQVGALSYEGLEILSPAMNVVTAVKLTRAAKGAAAKAGK